MSNAQYAVEPFGTLDGVLRGDPFKIFPVGTWHREDRKLEVTPKRLKEFAANVKAGLPNFRIPINIEHDATLGKYGTVNDVAYLETGPDGPGLYATNYELTEAGRELVREKKFDGVSGEAVWTLNGAKYQDPATGKYSDNVLVGVALTARPYFGKEVNLFSAFPKDDAAQQIRDAFSKLSLKEQVSIFNSHLQDHMADNSAIVVDKPKGNNGFKKLKAAFREKLNAWLDELQDKDGNGEPDDAAPEGMSATASDTFTGRPIVFNLSGGNSTTGVAQVVKELLSTQVNPPPTPPVAETPQGDTPMADPITTPAPTAPETFSVSAEEFVALKAKAEKAAQLETEFAAQRTQLETFAAQYAAEKTARRLEQLTARYETFSVDKPTTLAEKFAALEQANPELFKYFDGLLETLSGQLRQSALFAQFSKENTGAPTAEDLDGLAKRIVKEEFSGDIGKYNEALGVAAKRRPDLFAEYRAQAKK